ncbi:MAG: cytochrome C oxidase subunit IV family protein [Acidimicrobiia bacterium]|nr:cytochrome C oxidase subunit IV family protein [Acidimicrobiia bacterium]
MTTETTETEEVVATAEVVAHDDHLEEHIDHPSPKQYWLIAFVLAVITAVEIAVPSIEALDGWVGVSLLFILGGIKFGMVVALFMHLKFERPLYKMLFLIGLVGALAMFIVVLLTFQAI